MKKNKILPKYTPILVIDGKTVGIKSMMVQKLYDDEHPDEHPIVNFNTTTDDSFYLTPCDANELIDSLTSGDTVYVSKCSSSSQNKCDKLLGYSDIHFGLGEYEEEYELS